MDYKNMDEITKYCKNNKVDLNEELIGSLTYIKSINEKLFPILKLESWLAKKLLWCYWLFERDLSSFFEREDIDFEEIIYCLNLIASQGSLERMQEMCLACMNDTIRQDRNALYLIARQDHWKKMSEMRQAYEYDVIREDKELLELIAIQDSLECMRMMRLLCHQGDLRQDRDLLYFIANQYFVSDMEVIWHAHLDGLSTAQIKEMFKNALTIDKKRAWLEQELVDLLKLREFNLSQESPELNGETIVDKIKR